MITTLLRRFLIGLLVTFSLCRLLPIDGIAAQLRQVWDAVSGALSGYRLYRNGSSLSGLTSQTEYTDATVTVGSTYTYTVRSVTTSFESPDSNVVTVTISAAPSIPASLMLTSNPGPSVHLSWGASSGNALAGYNIYRAESSPPTTKLLAAPVTGLQYDDAALV